MGKRTVFYSLTALTLLLLIVGCTTGTTAVGSSRLTGAQPRPASVAAQAEPTPRTVNVNGVGTATAAPDVAYVQLGVQIIESDADLAVTESTQRMTAVMDVIKEMGIAEKDVQTVQYNMVVQQQYDREGKPTGEITYRITNQVRVTLRDLTQVGELLQKTLAAGANTVGGVTFGIEDPDALIREARDRAIADARSKAEQLATGLGAQLGSVRQIVEFGGGTPVPQAAPMMEMRAAAPAPVPISGGELTVSVQIQVVFDLAE